MASNNLTVYATRAELPKALQIYARVAGDLEVFTHPFLTTLFPLVTPVSVEAFIDRQRQRFREHLAKGEFRLALLFVTRPYRMDYLVKIGRSEEFGAMLKHEPATAEQFWQAAAWVWTDSEHSEDSPVWTDLMNLDVPRREAMTCETGRSTLAQLPDLVRIFRGVRAKTDSDALEACSSGWQWTLDIATAEFFAERFDDDNLPYVITAEVPKALIHACLMSRGESEVLLMPGSVTPDMIRSLDCKAQPGWRP